MMYRISDKMGEVICSYPTDEDCKDVQERLLGEFS